jgi:hypothetical protein
MNSLSGQWAQRSQDFAPHSLDPIEVRTNKASTVSFQCIQMNSLLWIAYLTYRCGPLIILAILFVVITVSVTIWDDQWMFRLRPNAPLSCWLIDDVKVKRRLLTPSKQMRHFFLVILCWPPLWSSVRSSWLQMQRFGFDYRRYQIFWEVVDLERSPLSLVSTTEELLERKISGSGLERREYGPRGSADKRSLGRCGSLADSDHEFFIIHFLFGNNKVKVGL